MQKACSMLLLQCTDNLNNRLETIPYFKQFNRGADALGLIVIIKGLVFKFEYQKNIVDALCIEFKSFYG